MELSGWRVRWERNEVPFNGLSNLDGVLDDLQERFKGEDGQMVEVVSPEGDSLAIGLGKSKSVLSYVSRTGDPPYYVSVGTGREDETISFLFSGEFSEFSGRNTISLEAARAAVRAFVQTGELSPLMSWEE